MTKIAAVRAANMGFMPLTLADLELVEKISPGATVKLDVTMMRNPEFHKQGFRLFKFAFDQWDPPEGDDDIPRRKNFELFRKDLTIMAGYYTQSYSLREDRIILEAESLAWDKMDEVRFKAVYRDVKRVVWEKVISTKGSYTEQQFENVLAQLMTFD